MKLRRPLALAVATAVAAPLALTVATPALAAAPAAQVRGEQPTYAELEKAAAAAQKAYDEAEAAEAESVEWVRKTFKELASDDHPLKAAMLAAEKAAKEAAAAEEAAEKAVTDAEAELAKAVTDEEKAEAQKAVDTAEAALAQAAKDRKDADARVRAASDAWNDARVAAARKVGKVQQELEKARKAKEAADKALAAAKDCVRESGLTTLAEGLPAKVVAGTTVDFTLRVTNGTEQTLTVDPLVVFNSYAKNSELTVEWSDGKDWHALENDGPEHVNDHVAALEDMKPGDAEAVPMRLRIEAGAAAGDALALFAGDASSAYRPCVLGPMKRYDFKVLPEGSKPGEVDEAKPGKPGKDDDRREGGAGSGSGSDAGSEPGKKVHVTEDEAAEPAATGNLAATGTSPAVLPLAGAGAAALAVGAAAVLVTRRRKG